MLDMCYASSAKEYRKQMGGAPDATSLPAPTDEGIQKWEKAAKAFESLNEEIADALRAAEAAHTGAAADAANASIGEIKPIVDQAAQTSRQVKGALEDQNTYQHEAFRALPAEGDPLPSGQQAILEQPQKGWVEDWGLDSNPVTGWMSDYEERQQAYIDTNQQANQAMERYSQQTDAVVARLPEFQPVDQPPPPGAQQPVGVTPSGGSTAAGGSGADYAGSAYGGTPSGTSSASASAPAAHAGAVNAGGSSAPAGTSSAWAQTPGGALPPGVVRGPDGALYRKNPKTGAWEKSGRGSRNNSNNGGAAAPVPGGRGGAFGPRGGAGALGGGPSAGAPSAGAPGAAGSRGAGGMGAGAGAGGRGQQGDDEQDHERPGWLVEADDVWTNDMQRTAPPVFGDVPAER